MTAVEIMQTPEYTAFLDSFSPNCKHIFVNSHYTDTIASIGESKDVESIELDLENTPTANLVPPHITANDTIAKAFPANFPKILEWYSSSSSSATSDSSKPKKI